MRHPYTDALLAQLRAEQRIIQAIGQFKFWLDATGRSYLVDGLGQLAPGVAFREIMKRAGITEVKASDSVLETLPKLIRLIEQRCPPKKSATQ